MKKFLILLLVLFALVLSACEINDLVPDKKYKITFLNFDETIIEEIEIKKGETPFCSVTPTRSEDEEYQYVFAGWDKSLVAANSDAKYIATYSQIKKDIDVLYYTIRFYNGNDLLLEKQIKEGEMIVYDGPIPTKKKTTEFSFEFIGWDHELASVNQNMRFNAQYKQITNEYKIQFVDEDGTLLDEQVLPYGSDVTYHGNDPIKENTKEYSYSFKGWDQEVLKVTGDKTYKATYNQTKNTYIILFLNADGSVLDSQTLPYGSEVKYQGEEPTLEANLEFSYRFIGWDLKSMIVVDNATYEARFEEIINYYDIDFIDYDDEIIVSYHLPYGSSVEFTEENPSREADKEFTYEFIGWNQELTKVDGNKTYQATYKSTTNEYIIKFINEDNSLLDSQTLPYGSEVIYRGQTPSKAEDDEYYYVFAGWNPKIINVVDEAIYQATFNRISKENPEITYQIRFVDEDGTLLKEVTVKEGEYPICDITPSKDATAMYVYTFSGWDQEISPADKDMTYKATYLEEIKKYTITFVGANNELLDKQELAYGSEVTYKGKTPTKAKTAEFTYTFSGWDQELSVVTKDMTYKALFSSTINTYTITFINDDNTELDKQVLPYGSQVVYAGNTPTKANTAEFSYAFKGWDKEVSVVTKNVTYKATYNSTINTYTITWKNGDTKLEVDNNVQYGSLPTYNGMTPEKAEDEQYIYTFSGWSPVVSKVTSNITYQAQFNAVLKTDDYDIELPWITG